jgi:hypothetical protein
MVWWLLEALVLVARDYVVRNKGPITCFSVNPRGFPKPISDSSIALIAYLEELGGPQLTPTACA